MRSNSHQRQSVRGATRLGVVIVVVTLAERAEANPEIVLAVIGSLKTAVTKIRHVADRVHGPRHIIYDEHRDVEAPKQAGKAENKVEGRRHRQMREDVEVAAFP